MKQTLVRVMKGLMLASLAVAASHVLLGTAKADLVSYSAILSGPSEPASVIAAQGTSPGFGTAVFTIDTVSGALQGVGISGSYLGLSTNSTGVAIILGTATSNGSTVFNLVPPSTIGAPAGSIMGTPTFTPTQVTNLQAGAYYFNITATSFSLGAIRGQILPSVASVPEPGPIALAAVVGVLGLGGRFVASRRVRRAA